MEVIRNSSSNIVFVDDSGTLFRSNSVSSAVMSVFFGHEAPDYLQQVLDPVFELLSSYPTVLEVDPSKVAPESLDQNIQDLTTVLRTFMNCILDSPETVPK
jgi:hypothetical protein